MFFCTIIYSIILAAHAFTLENHCTKKCSHHGSDAVDEGTHFTILVYCDQFYELALYSY